MEKNVVEKILTMSKRIVYSREPWGEITTLILRDEFMIYDVIITPQTITQGLLTIRARPQPLASRPPHTITAYDLFEPSILAAENQELTAVAELLSLLKPYFPEKE